MMMEQCEEIELKSMNGDNWNRNKEDDVKEREGEYCWNVELINRNGCWTPIFKLHINVRGVWWV